MRLRLAAQCRLDTLSTRSFHCGTRRSTAGSERQGSIGKPGSSVAVHAYRRRAALRRPTETHARKLLGGLVNQYTKVPILLISLVACFPLVVFASLSAGR
ncbi:hypothetical protein M433DRAFT_416980 [Acidomyces richmondensis BFW]|nr:MAG: hypothetical protein FE78DRAFT_227153 [Acidomyces sp. 'richmondensis']KYG42375.1 hypothetical protein M433DRAFT_416980 [Acidomyces richmondensis BFW]